MRVSCPSCQTKYNVDDARIPPSGAKLKCAKCGTVFPVGGTSPAPSVPLPAPPQATPGMKPVAGSVPLPSPGRPEGAAAPSPSVPLPGAPTPAAATAAASVPLPGLPTPPPPVPRAAPAVPLPPAAVSAAPPPPAAAIPLPAAQAPALDDDFDFADTAMSPSVGGNTEQVPLPPPDESVDLAGGWGDGPGEAHPDDAQELPSSDAAIPLPGGPGFHFGDDAPTEAAVPAAPDPDPFALFSGGPDSLPPPGEHTTPFGQTSAPPPEPSSEDVDFADADLIASRADIPIPSPEALDSLPETDSFDIAQAEPVSAAHPTDPFGAASPAPAEQDFGLPPLPTPSVPDPAPGFDAAAEVNVPTEEVDLDVASLNAPLPGLDELGAPPGGSDPLDMDLGLPPPPPSMPAGNTQVDVATDFGDVDFGDIGSAAPGAPAPAAPPPAAANDGLEVLDFEDRPAPAKAPPAAPPPGVAAPREEDAPTTQRYQIRRRTGKVFGPFDEGVVVKMLQDGQLLGNEDVSTDEDNWVPIGSVPLFAQTVQRMTAPADSPVGDGALPSPSTPSSDKVPQLYEGRMAAVAAVNSATKAKAFRKRLRMAAIGAAVLAVIGAGFALGATRYGIFGMKVILPARLADGSPEQTTVKQAQESFAKDTFKAYREARDAVAGVLQVKEYPEARAVWSQAVFYLKRRYGVAPPADLEVAEARLPDLELFGKKHPEVVKALAGAALVQGDHERALALLDEALARADSQNDSELRFLRAEAYVGAGQPQLAVELLTQLAESSDAKAKAHHALGEVHQRAKEVDKATEAFQKALAADPEHVASGVELAALALLEHDDVDGSLAAVEKVLTDGHEALLGPSELSRAYALQGEALARKFKVKEARALLDKAVELDPRSTFAKAALGRTLLVQREYEKALPLFKEAAESDPRNLEATQGYLSTLIATGKMDDALKQVQAANERFPGNARIAYLSGRVEDALDHTLEAEGHYQRAVNADEKLVEARLALAQMYLRLKRLSDAKQQLEAAAAQAPDNAAVHAGLGDLAFAEKDLERARVEFETASQADPTLAEVHLGLSRVALAQGDLATAAERVDKALDLHARVSGGQQQRGLVLWKQGKLKESIAAFEQARQDEPRSKAVLVNLGAVKFDQGDLSGAEAALLAALQDGALAEAHFYLARVRSKRGEHSQAIEAIRAAVDAEPKLAEYRLEMGRILREAKRAAEAADAWRQAMALDPKMTDAYQELGQLQLERGDIEGATEQFTAALKLEPGNGRLLALMGDCYFQAGRWPQAAATYLRALQAQPTMTQVYFKIARTYSERGQHAQAIQWYRKATDSEGDNPMTWYHLGYAYKERGQRKDAVAAFKNYLAKKPDAEDKRDIEDEIYDLQTGL